MAKGLFASRDARGEHLVPLGLEAGQRAHGGGCALRRKQPAQTS